jgi:PEGA domain-containing protein
MPEQEITGPIGSLSASDSPSLSFSKLTELARQAYEQKRTKDCLDLTRAILLVDPGNAEAHLLRSSIRSEMNQDLENARTLLRNAQSKDSSERLDQADATPSGTFELDSNTEQSEPVISETTVSSSAAAVASESDGQTAASIPSRSFRIRIPRKRQWLKRASLVVFVGLLVVGLPRFRSKSNPVEAPSSLRASDSSTQIREVNKENLPVAAPTAPAALAVRDDDFFDIRRTDSLSMTVTPAVTESASSITDRSSDADRPAIDSVSNAQHPASKTKDKSNLPAATGMLAVSSQTSVDIYLDDTYLGSAPVSLELPAGMHTIEYRHGNLRKRVTHSINSNETTRIMVTFDVTIRINSKPWADVYLEGTDRKPLGQTPLSGLRVPIGAVLSFENPGFPKKTYRVTGNETGIQIVFP